MIATLGMGSLIAAVIMPSVFLATFVILLKQREPFLTYCAYFVLCGSVGGWGFAFANSPSGITASSIVFLLTIAPVVSLSLSIALSFSAKRSRAASVAMMLGYFHPFLLALFIFAGSIILG